MTTLKKPFRNDIAELFLMLCSFSIRAKQFSKALTYGRVGHKLFPNDLAFLEYYAYSMMLLGELDEANSLLNSTQEESPNICFLKARVGMLREGDPDDVRRNLTTYLELTG